MALLLEDVEWEVLLPTGRPISPYIHRCIWVNSFQLTGHWFKLAWPCDLHRIIAALELIPVVVAAMLWGDNWRGKLVCFHSDNEAVVSVLNKGHAQDVTLTHLMQCLAFLAACHGFHFSSVHVPGRLNKAADALSHNNLTLFHSLLPQALQESIIPLSVVQLLVSEILDWGSPTWTKFFNSCLGRGSPLQHCPPTSQAGDAIAASAGSISSGLSH